MGWCSYLEDVTERFNDAQHLLGKLERTVAGQPRAANSDLDEARKQIDQLRILLGLMKGQLDEALDYVTDPSRALDIDPAAFARVAGENAELATRLAEEAAARKVIEHQLRKSQVQLVSSRVDAREATEKVEFLRAMGGQRILDAGKKKKRHHH